MDPEYAGDVQAGDIVKVYKDKPLEVNEVRLTTSSSGYRRVEFWNNGSLLWTGPVTQAIRLVHRPRRRVVVTETKP